MTLAAERIGDKGQRYEIRSAESEEDTGPYQILGYSTTREGAARMASAWSLHPTKPFVWIVDRSIPHGGDEEKRS